MLKSIALLLIAYQVLIVVYFLVINSIYTYITFYAYGLIRKSSKASIGLDRLARLAESSNFRPVSIVIPARNEEINLPDTILTALKVHYPEKEVVVVNDGSDDGTMRTLTETFDLVPSQHPFRAGIETKPVRRIYHSLKYPELWVIDKEKGGKADALNVGLLFSHYPLFCAIDADSILDPDAILRMGHQFLQDKDLVAAGGCVRVLNGCVLEDQTVKSIKSPKRILENIQIAEYLRGFMAGRVAWGSHDSLMIISGAFGIFRKDLLLAIGGYRKTVGEDMDLILRLHTYCVDHDIDYRVHFIPEPVCWTQVPSDLGSLLRQRNRWQRGLFDSIWQNRKIFLNRKYGRIGMIGMPYFVFVELLGPIVEFIGYFGFVLFLIFGLVNPLFAVLFLTISVLWGMWLNASAVFFDNFITQRYMRLYDSYKIAILGSLEYIGYRQLVAVERLIGTFQVWRGHWGKAKRKPIATSTTSG